MPSVHKHGSDPQFILDPDLISIDPVITEAIRYWEQQRRGRRFPSRQDLHPRELKAILPHFQLFELVDGGPAYRARLLGTEIVRQIKADTTGETFDETSSRLVVQRVLKAIRWVIDHQRPLRTFALRTAVEGREFLAHETIFLPLSSDGTNINMLAVVGVFSPMDPSHCT